MYIKSACDECLPCLLEKVSGLESQSAKDEGSGRCYKDRAGRGDLLWPHPLYSLLCLLLALREMA